MFRFLNPNETPKRNPAEWVSFGISVLLVGLLFGFLFHQHFTQGTEKPRVEVTLEKDKIYQEKGNYYLPVSITNPGDDAAEDLTVEISLTPPSGEEETSEITIKFLDSKEVEEATAVFDTDPKMGELAVDELSFLNP